MVVPGVAVPMLTTGLLKTVVEAIRG
jgi:hypothetical protein